MTSINLNIGISVRDKLLTDPNTLDIVKKICIGQQTPIDDLN